MKTKRIILAILLVAGTTYTYAQDSISIQDLSKEVQVLRNKILTDSITDAQNLRYERIWKKSTPWIIAWGHTTFESKEAQPVPLNLSTNLAFSVSKRKTFYLHKKPIAGMMKFGLDLTFFDFNFAIHSKGHLSANGIMQSSMGNVTSGTYESAEDFFHDVDKKAITNNSVKDGNNTSLDRVLDNINIGRYQFSPGVLGIGPSFRIVPFYALGKPGLDKLKVTLYFHYQPSYTVLIDMKEENKHLYHGYIGQWRCGMNIAYDRLGIGVEHNWGGGRVKQVTIDEKDEGLDLPTDKVSAHISNFRLYIGFRL